MYYRLNNRLLETRAFHGRKYDVKKGPYPRHISQLETLPFVAHSNKNSFKGSIVSTTSIPQLYRCIFFPIWWLR